MISLFVVAAAMAQPVPKPPTPAVQATIKRYWETELVDAPSARWLWPLQRDSKLYCGWINAKNRLGGYGGWTPYVIIFEGTKIKEGYFLPGRPEMARAMGSNCVEAGYDVESPPR